MKTTFMMVIVMVALLATAGGSFAIHEEIPAETQRLEGEGTTPVRMRSDVAGVSSFEALVNLLERKGIITRDELEKEIERMKRAR